MPIQQAVRQQQDNHHKSVQYLLDNPEKTNLVMGIVRDFKHMVRKPDGKLGWSISLNQYSSPEFSIYCCVKSFSNVSPIVKILADAGYKIRPESTEDNQYSMSRKFLFCKGSYYNWDRINILAFALKELGAECRAVSIGYSRGVSSIEEFKLVCDDMEEAALKMDIENPNYL